MTTYPIVIEQTSEVDFGAYVPDLPGCVALGDTIEEVHQSIQEAIQLYIESLQEDGLPVPAPYSSISMSGLKKTA